MERTRIIPFASNKCCQSSTSVDLRKAMSISCAKPARSNAKANLFKVNGISNATSQAAAKPLNKLMREPPFKVKLMQVDEGSEFLKDFEAECVKHKISLYRPHFSSGQYDTS